MISKKKAESLIDFVLSYAEGKAQGAEVCVNASDFSTSRFANNSMTQNQAPDRAEVSVRIIKNGRQVRLSSDDLSANSLRRLVDDALTACKFLEKDIALLALPTMPKLAYPQVNRLDRATAELDAQQRSKAVKGIIAIAEKRGLNAAGIVSSGSALFSIGNSKGLYATHRQSSAECSITMYRDASTGWAKADYSSFAELDVSELANRAAEKAIANRDPVEISPGKYRVILEPSAVLDLVCFLNFDFAATSHLDKLSCFQDKLGKKVLGDNISIRDDVTDPGQNGCPFDGEGLPRKTVNLVEHGVVKNLVAGRRSASKLGMKATGHGFPEPNSEGEYPANIVFAGGDTTLPQMVADADRAILLTRVWYIREVDPEGKIVTGMTRDGTFLVEDGKVISAVKNLRFNQSIIEMLNNVEKLGPAVRTAGEEGIPAVVPAMQVANFNFASTTTF